VLSCLDSRFDHHLAQAENLRSLFIALNDEVFEIRELAITTIGRLTIRNPAYVMPSLRKTLIQLLTELGTQPTLKSFAHSTLLTRTHAHKCRVQRRQPQQGGERATAGPSDSLLPAAHQALRRADP
jgi:phosphatidylinositol kinase/protein kinase (PI-3  family)